MGLFQDERCYRPDEVAEKLSIDLSTVYRLTRNVDDPLPAFRLRTNGQLRLLGRELNSYFERQRLDPLNE